MPPEAIKAHNHVDNDNDSNCDVCGVKMCSEQKAEGAQNLMCSRVLGHKGKHFDRKQKVHF